MRVLHIVHWYPNVASPTDAPFVRRHIEAMRTHAEQLVWHIAVLPDSRWRLETRSLKADRTFLLHTPLRTWIVIEWLTTLLVLWAWVTRKRSMRFDIVSFYIAYPLCTRLGVLRSFIRKPMMMMEQWSGYHFDLGVNPASRGLDRIRRIFRHRIPVICVSESLANDIRRFSGVKDLVCPVVPNVVDVELFREDGRSLRSTPLSFFAMANWKRPKCPEVVIDAMALVLRSGLDVRLRLAGFGPQLELVKERIAHHGLQDRVDLLGWLDPVEAANEMRQAFGILHPSDYETFSVVCAESLCCGTPVIASKVGGIPSFVNDTNGVLVGSNDAGTWARAIADNWQRLANIDRREIAASSKERFSSAAVGARLHALFDRRAAGDPLEN